MEDDEKIKRKSVVDPVVVKVNGQPTKATSSKVDRTADAPRTKMVDDFQMQVLKKSKKSKQRHTCPVCLVVGHHAKTCSDILAPENRERCNQYLKKMHTKQRLRAFVISLAKRHSRAAVKTVIAQLVSVEALTDDDAKSLMAAVDSGQES